MKIGKDAPGYAAGIFDALGGKPGKGLGRIQEINERERDRKAFKKGLANVNYWRNEDDGSV